MGTLGNSVDKYVTGRMLQTSNDRRWSHLLAEIWSHEAGELPSQLPRDTEIAIQLRGHSLVDRRGAGMHQRTLGRKGTVWLCPAGISEDFINIENPMQECLHVFLPGKPFDEAMLRDLDIDPSGISIRYEAIDRDPFIEFVADQILKEMEVESSTRPAFDRKPRRRPVGPSGARLCGDVRSPETIDRREQAARSETALTRDGFHQRFRRARFYRQ
jgi:AraC family transcriptional regulator